MEPSSQYFTITNRHLTIVFIFFLCVNVILGIFLASTYIPALNTLISSKSSDPIDSLIQRVSAPNQSKEDYAVFLSDVAKYAKSAPSINVAACAFSPKIYRGIINTQVVFQNSGNQVRFITIPNQKPIKIEAGKSATVPLTFIDRTPFVIGIGCDGSEQAAGILYITQ